MRIVFYEMKKIWNMKMLLIITALCAFFYLMFLEYEVDFPNGHPAAEVFDLSIQMTKEYGLTLEEAEHAAFVTKTRGELIVKAESYIQSMPIFAQAGIHTYADYEKVDEKEEQTELESEAIWTLLREACGFVGFQLEALDYIEASYDQAGYVAYLLSKSASERETARLLEIQETKEYRNIMSSWVLENTVNYSIYLSILAVLAVLILVSPLIASDRARNMHLLQYSAKQGRSMIGRQFAAVMLSAFLLATLLLTVFGALYSTNGTWVFWKNGMTSFLGSYGFFLFRMTYGQYILACIALIYMLCLGAAAFAFVLSRFSQNLIALILKLIPFFGLMGALASGVFLHAFHYGNILYTGTGIFGIEAIACGMVLLAGLAASVYTVRRERNVDVV